MRSRDEGPQWLAVAVRRTVRELRSFVTTGVSFGRNPRAFVEEWYRGGRTAMNPLGCLATAIAAVSFPTEQVLARYYPEVTSSSLLIQGFSAIGPYLHYGMLGALTHLFLRLTGSPPRLRSSVAVALFAGALPGSASSLLAVPVAICAAYPSRHTLAVVLAVVLLAAFGFFLWTLGVALAALHAASRKRAFAALGGALLVTGVVLRLFAPLHVHFGLHVSIGLHEPPGIVIP
jgi:hypothetical protein